MPKRPALPLLLAAAALAFHLFAGVSFIRSASPTFDEPVHLVAGYSYLTSGRFMMDLTGHPPLSEALSALPLAASRLSSFASHPYSVNGQVFYYADLFLYNNALSARRLLNSARLCTFLLWTGLSAWFLYRFGKALAGPEAGAYAVAAFALMPAFISNDALVTTDAAPAVFYLGAVFAAYSFARPPERPGKRYFYGRAAAAGLLAGLAMVSKYSMFVLPPFIIGLWALDAYLRRALKPGRLALFSAVFLAACFLAVYAVCLGRPGEYYEALRAALTGLDQGRSSFAWGRYSINGVWWYFPLALLVKTPPAVLFLAAASVPAFLKRKGTDWPWVAVPAAFFFAASLASKVQIGYRHILPVMPFLALAAGIGAGDLLKSRRALPLAAAALLCAGWGWGLWRTHPHYLAYFNEFAGGPANGYKLFVDSNLDWGQDLPSLAGHLEKEGNPPVILSYFGVGRPESYGISYTPLGVYFGSQLSGTGVQVCGLKRVLLGVSATNLQGVYYPDKKTFSWLKDRKPVFSAGYSLFLYDLTDDKDGLGRLAAVFDGAGRNAEAECLYRRAER